MLQRVKSNFVEYFFAEIMLSAAFFGLGKFIGFCFKLGCIFLNRKLKLQLANFLRYSNKRSHFNIPPGVNERTFEHKILISNLINKIYIKAKARYQVT